MVSKDGQILVLVTAPDSQTAGKIARGLLEARLAACVNISPGWTSYYHWEGDIQLDQELLLLIKSRQELLENGLIPLIHKLHPYQLPEIIALEITAGEPNYLEWILTETSPESSS